MMSFFKPRPSSAEKKLYCWNKSIVVEFNLETTLVFKHLEYVILFHSFGVQRITLIPALVSDHLPRKMCDEIT